MKQQIALLKLLLQLSQGVNTLKKFITKETTDELAIKGKALTDEISTVEVAAVIKALSKGITTCPFCEEEVRQITSHIVDCPSATAFEPTIFLTEPTAKVIEKIEEVQEGLPMVKLKCNSCDRTLESNEPGIHQCFWETGILCANQLCSGRMISNMSTAEITRLKEHRAAR